MENKQSQKKDWIPLRTNEDVTVWLEKAVNDMDRDTASLVQGNGRIKAALGRLRQLDIAMKYHALRAKTGVIVEVSEFFAAKPANKLLK